MVAADLVCGRIDDASTSEFTSMTHSFSQAQLERFRREAKTLGRKLSISHSKALDFIAEKQGFKNWSLLVKHSVSEGQKPVLQPLSARRTEKSDSKRYYLHGDLDVSDPTRCYCARCDYFVELTHFDGPGFHGDGADGARYLRSLDLHNELPSEHKAARMRPDNAPNILAKRAIQERDAYDASRSPFHRWLESQRMRNDPVGDLARDILGDTSFPVNLASLAELENHLGWHGNHIVRAIREAWKDFAATNKLPD